MSLVRNFQKTCHAITWQVSENFRKFLIKMDFRYRKKCSTKIWCVDGKSKMTDNCVRLYYFPNLTLKIHLGIFIGRSRLLSCFLRSGSLKVGFLEVGFIEEYGSIPYWLAMFMCRWPSFVVDIFHFRKFQECHEKINWSQRFLVNLRHGKRVWTYAEVGNKLDAKDFE